MTKKIGFWSIVLLTINSIIGSGIFLSPGAVVAKAGSKTPLIYFCAAIFASVLAVTFASASKYVSKSGAAYVYAKAAFGSKIGFYIGLTRYFATCISWGVLATGVVKILLTLFGFDSGNFMDVSIGFVLFMLVMLVINLLGPKVFKIINNTATIAKLSVLIFLILIGIFIVISTKTNHFADINNLKNTSGAPLIPKMTSSIFVMSTIAAFYAFAGFETVASGAGDMEKPEKNLPRAIPLAILIIAIIYILIVTVSMMIDPKSLILSKQVIALVAVFSQPLIKNLILYGALISMFGINVAYSFNTPRALEAISIEKQLSPWFKKRTKQDFPLRAFIITAVIAILIPMAFNYTMTSIMVISSISRFIQFLIVPLAVMMFFYNKNKEKVLDNVQKNIVTDVIIPCIGLVLTAVLLAKFDWLGMFTLINVHGGRSLNLFAILAMAIGYIIMPAVVMTLELSKQAKQSANE